MAHSKYIQALFGSGLVADMVMENLRKDLIGDLVSLLSSAYSAYGGSSYERMKKSVNAKNIISKRLPEDLDEFGLSTNFAFIIHIILALSTKSEAHFILWFTRNELTFLDKLKVQKIMKLFVEVKDQV